MALALALPMAAPGPMAAQQPAQQEPPREAIAAVRLARAHETRAFTERNLQHLAGGTDCLRAVFVSYARGEQEAAVSDQWYQVSQIWADLALTAPDDPLGRCWALRGFTFLDRFWDRDSPDGGFYPRVDLDGVASLSSDKYADDNSLAGLVWMEAAEGAAERLERELLIGRAQETADFLMFGGLWDETFGGGFWWNNHLGDSPEGKPSQTNGLAAEFFLKLYAMTGQPAYREWALKTLTWLDTKLYDRRAGLYRWSVHYADLDLREGEVVANRFFNYDQGILIEAHLLAYALLGEDPARLGRARSLGRAADKLFWDAQLGGYDLEAGVPQVFPVYSAWLSQSFLALYTYDRDPLWLARAGANLDALDRNAWDAAQGGYYQRYYLCRDPSPPGCADGAEQSADPEKLLVDQAWMQRAQALLARALLSDAERDAPKGGT